MKVKDDLERHQEKQSKNRNLVITGQYILKVMNRFIDVVQLESNGTRERKFSGLGFSSNVK